MGIGTTRTIERVAASLGKLQDAPPRFEPADDVHGGGVLLALPALLAIGLLRHTRACFQLPAGFYGIESLFLTLALTGCGCAKCATSTAKAIKAPS